MASPVPPLNFDTSFVPNTGRSIAIAPAAARVTAPNASPYTFTGTNSFLLGTESVAIVDPGPDVSSHLAALLAAIDGRPVEAIILTHTHKDHSALVPRLKAVTGAPVWFGGPHRLSRPLRRLEVNRLARSCDWALMPDRSLGDGEIFTVAGLSLQAIATPGHCANHLSFGLLDTPLLLTGDHIMGWNSTLVAVPDGSMADYLASLDKVIASPYTQFHPAHGGPIAEGRASALALRAHRQQRNAQVIAAIATGATSISKLRKAIYPTLALPLHAAAKMTLTAHVEYLAGRGAIEARPTLFGWHLGA
jgi:glyoxylase-like metal-dependent hydrolase (beta-lactamase superfamily II)